MKYPTNTNVIDGKNCLFTWMRGVSFDNFSPITQVYAIVFDKFGDILICRPPGEKWNIPGGTPEEGETLIETLERELVEEVDITVKNISELGMQKAEVINKSETVVYQVRYIAVLDKLHDQTLDPDKGIIYERKFVHPHEINKYVFWGELGKILFEDAVRLYQ